VDTDAQVSLVKYEDLKRESSLKGDKTKIMGITGDSVEVRGVLRMRINESEEFPFRVVEKLPRNLTVVLGQDWLRENNYIITQGIAIPPYSEKICTFPTKEKGIRYIESQTLKNGVFCASSLSECDEIFACLLVNVTQEMQIITESPKLQKPPCKSIGMAVLSANNQDRYQLLLNTLRLDHIREGKQELTKLCLQFADIFKLEGDKLTATSAATHNIPTPSIPKGRAITLKNYRLPEAHKEEVAQQIDKMLKDDIIVPSKSEWNFPIIMVPKKIDASGKKKWRLCIDFRKLNEVTMGDSYPLPNIQDILDKIGRARYFTTLDCASGYLQIPINPEDQSKTAFSTPSGHYEYKRMPFGLKSAPATFQRTMNAVLRDAIGDRCFVYMDDILILGETLREHNLKLHEVFTQLRHHNLKIEPDKCEFLRTELQYLGHIVTTEGVKPDPKKIKAVIEFPTPVKSRDIKSFLGLAGYYRKFINDFSLIAKPLTELLQKDTEWSWTEKQEESFQKLKEALTKAPLLQYPDFTQPFIVTTDASGYAIGAILSQGKLGQDRPIAYASRTLNKNEHKLQHYRGRMFSHCMGM